MEYWAFLDLECFNWGIKRIEIQLKYDGNKLRFACLRKAGFVK
jgi:hypothetical protein